MRRTSAETTSLAAWHSTRTAATAISGRPTSSMTALAGAVCNLEGNLSSDPAKYFRQRWQGLRSRTAVPVDAESYARSGTPGTRSLLVGLHFLNFRHQ